MLSITSNSRIHPNEWNRESIGTERGAIGASLDSSENFRTKASIALDYSNLDVSHVIQDEQLIGNGADKLQCVCTDKNSVALCADASNLTFEGGNNTVMSVLNKTGKYKTHKRSPETEKDKKIIFADCVEGKSVWEENYYVETHYTTKDLFGDDDVAAKGLGCKCSIV